jgi:methyl-accepting chemotaxis protein
MKAPGFRTKMMLLPALASVAFVVLLVVGLVLGRRNAALLDGIERGYAPALQLSRDLGDSLLALQRAMQDAVASEDPDSLTATSELRAAFLKTLDEGRKLPTVSSAFIDEVRQGFDAWYAVARATSERMIHKEQHLDADVQAMSERYARLRETLDGAIVGDRLRMAEAFRSAHELQRRSLWTTAGITLACLLLLIGISAWIIRSVTRPLLALGAAAARIAREGDLRQPIDVSTSDEIGALAQSFRDMVAKLRDVPLALQHAVDEMRAAVGELDGLAVRQNSIIQRQAIDLASVGTTTSEIRTTADAAAERASQARDAAVRGEEFADRGQTLLRDSLGGLEDMNREIQAIVDRVTGLSEKARTIGEITSTVKDLADQSNMLALNAAIEAIKAGAAGRTFGIVAREIRSLADQSGRATGRIQDVLQEIQEAITFAASMTEASSRKMTGSIHQIRTSAESLSQITTMIQQSTAATRQIAASVGQQSAGIADITSAIAGLGGSMNEAVSGIELVEVAVQRLKSTAEAVAQIVGSFRI